MNARFPECCKPIPASRTGKELLMERIHRILSNPEQPTGRQAERRHAALRDRYHMLEKLVSKQEPDDDIAARDSVDDGGRPSSADHPEPRCDHDEAGWCPD